MNTAVRRALSTPPTPAKEFVGKTEPAQSQRERLERGQQSQKRPDFRSITIEPRDLIAQHEVDDR